MTDEELIARLRKADEYEPLGHDGWEAADRIEELVRDRDEWRDKWESTAEQSFERKNLLIAAEDRIEALVKESAAIREAVAKVRTKLADQDNATLLLGAEWALTMIEALTEKP